MLQNFRMRSQVHNCYLQRIYDCNGIDLDSIDTFTHVVDYLEYVIYYTHIKNM